jgi:hypothetical protein
MTEERLRRRLTLFLPSLPNKCLYILEKGGAVGGT